MGLAVLRQGVAVAAAFGAVALAAAPAARAEGSIAFQGDASHSGYVSDPTLDGPLTKAWSRDLGSHVSYPIIADGRVFVAAEDGSLGTTMIYALDAATGETLWARTGGERFARTAYDNGRLFVYDEEGFLRALDAETGATHWIARHEQPQGNSAPVAADGVVIVNGAGSGTTSYAFRQSDGEPMWSVHGFPGYAPAAIADGRVFGSGQCAGARAHDLGTGARIWHRYGTPSCSWGDGYTTVVDGGRVYVRRHHGQAPRGAVLDAASGTELERFDADYAPATNGSVRVTLFGGVLRAEPAAGGPVLWTFFGDGRLTGAPFIAGNHVYAASAAGRVYKLDIAFGTEAWSDDTGAPISFTDSYSGFGAGDGLLAVPADGTLHAYSAGPVTGASPPPAPSDEPPGPAAPTDGAVTYQGNPAHDGFSADELPAGGLRERWSREMGTAVSYPVIADGRIFVAEADTDRGSGSTVRALDRESGQTLWSRSVPIADRLYGDRFTALSYVNGRLFVAAGDGLVRALDAADGRELWSKGVGSVLNSAPVAVGDLVYVLGDRSTFAAELFALDAEDGSVRWSRDVADGRESSPVVVGETVYAVGACEAAQAFDRHTGESRWQVPAVCQSLAGINGSMHAGRFYAGGRVYRASDGQLVDRSGPAEWRVDSPHVFAGRLALSLNGARLQAEDVRSGRLEWEFADPDGQWFHAPLVVGRRVVVRTWQGRLYVLDLGTGALEWSGESGGPVGRPPLLTGMAAADGALVVPTGGRLVVFGASDQGSPLRITSAPSETSDRRPEIGFEAPGASSFECRADGGEWAPCSSPWRPPELADGEHALSVRADGGTPVTHWTTVDTAAPDTMIGDAPSHSDDRWSPDVPFSSTEDATFARFECKTDDSAWVRCRSPEGYTASAALEDGPHVLLVRAYDRAGNVDPTPARHDWILDTDSPSITLSGPPDAGASRDVTFAISSDEPATYTCSLGGLYDHAPPWEPCESPKSYSGLADGAYKFQVRAEDPAGNYARAERIFRVDTTAPTARLTNTTPSGWQRTNSAWLYFDAGETATFECRLDGGSWAPCTSPARYSGLAEGEHNFAVRATDMVGNVGPEVTRTWSVDTIAPSLALDGPSGYTRNSTGRFSFSTDDPAARVTCAINKLGPSGYWGGYHDCTSPYDITRSDGSWELVVTAQDPAGNSSTVSRRWTVDTTPPQTWITSPRPSSVSRTAEFTYVTDDPGPAFECQLDNAAWEACDSGGKRYDAIPDGRHVFRVRAAAGGLADPTPAEVSWTVDTTAPNTTILTRPDSSTEATEAYFSFASESGATYACRIDAGEWAPCTSPTRYTGLGLGQHVFEVRASDSVGNQEAVPASWTWTISPPAPPDPPTPPDETEEPPGDVEEPPDDTEEPPGDDAGTGGDEQTTSSDGSDEAAASAVPQPDLGSFAGTTPSSETSTTQADDADRVAAATGRAAAKLATTRIRRLARRHALDVTLREVPDGHYVTRMLLNGKLLARGRDIAHDGRAWMRLALRRSALARLAGARRPRVRLEVQWTPAAGERVRFQHAVRLRR